MCLNDAFTILKTYQMNPKTNLGFLNHSYSDDSICLEDGGESEENSIVD